MTDIRAQSKKNKNIQKEKELKPLKPAAQEANLWWEHSREQTSQGSSGWSLNTNSIAAAQRLQHMGLLKFGKVSALFSEREQQAQKNANICPNRTTSCFVFVVKQILFFVFFLMEKVASFSTRQLVRCSRVVSHCFASV